MQRADMDVRFLIFAIKDDGPRKSGSAGMDACFLIFAIKDDGPRKSGSAGMDACFLIFAIKDDRKNKECCHEPRQAWICPQAARHPCAGGLRGPDVDRLRTLSGPDPLQRAGLQLSAASATASAVPI